MGGNVEIRQENWEDAFGNQVSARTNVLDLAGHYPYSPERWRIFVNGSRVFPEYANVSQYNHAGDYHELQPAAGETVTFESAERPRYVVQYELAATFAFAFNHSLASGDSIQVGLYDGTDGWYMEHDGSHTDMQADFVLERDGTEVYRRQDITLAADLLSNRRLRLQTGWYDVTRSRWEQSFSDSGRQRNEQVLSTGADTARGSKTGNLPLRFQVTASASTSDLVLEAGSAAQVNLGTTTAFNRSKIIQETATISTTDTWVPLLAVRVDPDRDITNVQLSDLAAREFTGNADMRLAAMSCAPANVLDSGDNQLTDSDFTTPETTLAQNSVVETSDAIAKFPDDTGTPITSTDSPGGYQVAYDDLYTGGGNTIAQNAAAIPAKVKRPIFSRDVLAIIARAGATGDITFTYRTIQDW